MIMGDMCMSRPDFVVIGAGPAGAAFAYYATRKGYSVTVYDQAPWPGFKACGWAVPRQIEDIITIPRETILTEIRGFRVYLDGRLVHEKHGMRWGYIIDKRAFLEYLLRESYLYTKKPVLIDKERLRVLGETERPLRSYVLATGSSSMPQDERIYAVQRIIRPAEPLEEDTVEFWFDRNLVGYYWVFPRSSRIVDIGVGGYGEPQDFIKRLEIFIKTRFGDKAEPIEPYKGSWINVGGVMEERFYAIPPVIGEAAGFVYPLTGEGIRPSIVSAYAAINRIEGKPLPDIFTSTTRWITIQKQILESVKSSRPETRAKIISRLPVDVLIGIGVGELSPLQLLRALPSLPTGIAAILRDALKRK